MLPTDSADRSTRLEQLSALADGELGEAATAQACASWRGDADTRSSWHTYHLIGDVLRSEDLAVDPARDAGFMAALRLRLAAEPVVLAPRPLESAAPMVEPVPQVVNGARGARRSWKSASVMVAAFVAVVGVVALTRGPAALAPDTSLAQGAAAPGSVGASAAVPVSADPQVLVANGKLIRDVRLDRYLAAHKQFAGTSALGVPSGFLRSATADAADR